MLRLPIAITNYSLSLWSRIQITEAVIEQAGLRQYQNAGRLPIDQALLNETSAAMLNGGFAQAARIGPLFPRTANYAASREINPHP
jgi:hypothetical protein